MKATLQNTYYYTSIQMAQVFMLQGGFKAPLWETFSISTVLYQIIIFNLFIYFINFAKQ